MKKSLKCFILTLVVCFAVSSTALAFQLSTSNPLDGIAVQDSKIAWEISKAYEMSVLPEHISYLHSNLGYGEITLLYGLAETSGKPVSDILAMRKDDGLGWGQIAQKLGVKLGDVTPKTSQILKNAKLDSDDKALAATLNQEANAPKDKPVANNKDKDKDNGPKVGHTFSKAKL
jgi:hypothetical protein